MPADSPETPLARLIEERGLRKGWVAKRLGISASGMSRLLYGERRMTLDEGVRLADLLGVDVRELLGDAS
jgi:plasmid maintenance system antidote protein VapI